MRRSPGAIDRPLVALLVLALALRLLVAVGTADVAPRYDAADYDRHAAHIAAGAGYPPSTYAAAGTPSAFRPPAWPYLLGGLYDVTGQRWAAARLLGALLGALTVLLVFLIARRLWGRSTALTAAGLAAVLPPLVLLNASLLSEVLFTPLVLALVLVLLRAQDAARRWPWAVAAGALLGLAALTRAAGLVLLAPAAWALWRASDATAPRRLAGPAVAALAMAAVLTPWTVRNLDAFGTLVPVSTQSGYTLAGTYNDEARRPDGFRCANRIPAQVPALAPILHAPGRDEAQLDAALGSAGRRFAGEHPGYVARCLLLNGLRQFNLGGSRWLTVMSYEEMGIPRRLTAAVTASGYLLLALALAGVVLARRRRRPRAGPAWLWAVPALMFLTTIVISGAPRYRAAIDPFLVLLAASALAPVRLRRPRRARG